ncbi:MAG: DUF6064 family protein [Geminicoccaceae bacterium]
MLPYDTETLLSAVAGYHSGYSLVTAVVFALAAITLLLAVWCPTPARRAVPLLLAACWVWIAAVWHFGIFAQLNFAAPAYGSLFLLQAAFLAWFGYRGLEFGPPIGWPGVAGFVLAVIALVGLPIVDLLRGWPWLSVRLAGVDPCPTAVLTLGVLLLSRPPRVGAMIIPALWTLVAAATGWVLGIASDMLLPAAAALACTAAVIAGRRAQRPAVRISA